MRPLEFLAFNLQWGNIGSTSCCQFVRIWSWYIWLCTQFVEVIIGWKTIVLFYVQWSVKTQFAVVTEVLRPISVSDEALLPQLRMLIENPNFVQCGVQGFRHVKLNPFPKFGRKKS